MSSVSITQTKTPSKKISASFSILLGLMILCLIALIFGSVILFGQRILNQQRSEFLTLAAHTYSEKIKASIQVGEAALAAFIQNPDSITFSTESTSSDLDNPSPEEDTNESLQLFKNQTEFQQLLVIDKNGVIRFSSNPEWVDSKLPEEIIPFLSSQQKTFSVSPPPNLFRDSTQPDPFSILSSVPISTQSYTNPEYWILGLHDPHTLLSLPSSIKDLPGNVYWILNEDVWLHVNEAQQIAQYKPSTEQVNNWESVREIDQNYHPVIVQQALGLSYAYSPLDDMGIVMVFETTSLQGFFSWIIQQPEIIPLLAAFFLLIILILITPNMLLRPLSRLANDVAQFTEGNWEHRAQIQQNNELGVVSKSFNFLANEVQQLSRRLDTHKSDHNDKIFGLAKLSQIALLSPGIEELTRPILMLTLKHFDYQHAALYLLSREPDGNYAAIYHSGAGDAVIEKDFVQRKIILNTINEAQTAVAKAFSTKQPAYTSKENPDEFNPGHADILHELAIPLRIAEKAIGCLSIKTISPRQPIGASYAENDSNGVRETVSAATNLPTTPRYSPFSDVKVAELQIIANQLSLAFRSIYSEGRLSPITNLAETSDANLIYQAGARISQADSMEDVFSKTAAILQDIPYSSALLLGEGDSIQIVHRWPGKNENAGRIIRQLPGKNILPVSLRALSTYFKSSTPILVNDIRSTSLPQALVDIPRQMGCDSAAFLPVMRSGKILSLLIIGQSRERKDTATQKTYLSMSFNSEILLPYNYLIETISTTIEKIQAQEDIQKRLAEVQTLWNISQAISLENDLSTLYSVVHTQAEKVMGKFSSFAILLYDEQNSMIQVPYIIEEGKNLDIKAFPLGEGLTSIVLTTGKPLLIDENVEKNMREMGAKTVGATAKSWLGVPLKYGGESFGVIIAQDIFREHRFSEEDQRLLSTIASQVALVIRNVRLLERSKTQARMERIQNQITGKIRRAMDMDSILQTTADELAYALNARKADIKIEIMPTQKKNGKDTSILVNASQSKP